MAGDTRIDTAVDIARDTYDQADTAVLATARNYPDALSGSVLAETLDAPLLLVEPDLEDRFGDNQADRIAGATRYHTATGVAQPAIPDPDTVVLATGEDFPDAVSASALAASRGWPVILTAHDQVRDAVATSHAVATRQLTDDPTTVWVATGADYPDALTAGAAAAAPGAALHLTDPATTDLDATKTCGPSSPTTGPATGPASSRTPRSPAVPPPSATASSRS